LIPDLSGFRSGSGRLKGLRCIHTHLRGEPISQDDHTDLAMLRLDLMVVLQVDQRGIPALLHYAHLLPDNPQKRIWHSFEPKPLSALRIEFLDLIGALEDEFAHSYQIKGVKDERDRAVLIRVATSSKIRAEDSLRELETLAKSCKVEVLDSIIQKRAQIDSRYVMGRGKLSELVIRCLQLSANLLIFDQELSPAQVRSISDFTELKIIDRTQLILDIFAQRAKSREGKFQVELAQLKYLLPRLITKNTAMSRLTGGIGGRGPGETKLEINRRRVKDRIGRLKKELELISRRRRHCRSKRAKQGIAAISLVGYTNAGKSTLQNALTKSNVLSKDQPFTTLDPTSRKFRFSQGQEAIITDTVGFIRDLPKDLVAAFSATLDELKKADLLLHVVDVSDPNFKNHISAVEKTIELLQLNRIPIVRIFNKEDKADKDLVENYCRIYQAISISAKNIRSLIKLVKLIEPKLLPGAKKVEYLPGHTMEDLLLQNVI